MPKEVSVRSTTASLSGAQKLGQPVWLSNLVREENSGRAQPAQAKARATIEAFRQYAVAQIEASLRRAAERGEIDPALDFPAMADFILTAMWGAKAAIRHAGSTAAAAPTARMLTAILRSMGPTTAARP
jgi:hypothetical protein